MAGKAGWSRHNLCDSTRNSSQGKGKQAGQAGWSHLAYSNVVLSHGRDIERRSFGRVHFVGRTQVDAKVPLVVLNLVPPFCRRAASICRLHSNSSIHCRLRQIAKKAPFVVTKGPGCTGHYLKKNRKSLEGSTVLLGPKPRTYSMGTLITLIRDPLGMIQSFVKRDFRL